MDPLSITASAIALGGFAGAIGKGIRTLKGLANIPDEFRALLDELVMLQIVARAVDDLKHQIPTRFSTTDCDTLCQTLRQTIHRLEVLATRFEGSSRGLDKHGRTKIPRISWIQERSNIHSLREQARQSRDYITAYLTMLSISESSRQSSILLGIQGLTHASFGNLASVGEDIGNTEGRLDHIGSNVGPIAGLQSESISCSSVCEMLEDDRRSRVLDSDQVQNHPATYTNRSVIPWFDEGTPTQQRVHAESVLRLQAALSCRIACRCSCHKSTTVHAPSSLWSVIGTLSLSYNSTITFGNGPCNYAACNGPSTRRVQFSYHLPQWIGFSAVQFSALWGSPRDKGATLSLKLPRVISSDDGIWDAIVHGDLRYIQGRFSDRKNFPTDVEERTGRSLIAHAISWQCHELIKLFLREGADVSVKSVSGLSGVSRAKQHLLLGHGDDEARAIYQQIVELGGDEHQSTVIHDSILGINDIGVYQAIEMEPGSLNSLDATGYTPLHWAIRLGNSKAIDALLCAKADTNVANFWLSTPLHTAVRRINLPAVEQLLKAGSDPKARDMDGQTPLHEALSRDIPGTEVSSREIIKLLLQQGSDPNSIDRFYKQSPLNWYVSRPHQDMETFEANIDALLAAGADLEQVDKRGCPPLFNCIRVEEDRRTLRALSSRGARLDFVNNFQQTVIHAVAMWGNLNTTEYITGLTGQLLDLDLKAQDMNGYKALDYITLRASSSLEELLELQIPGIRPAADGEVTAFQSLICELQDRRDLERIIEDSSGLRGLLIE